MLPMMAGYLSAGGAAADWWAVPGKTCVVAYQPKGAASLAASYTNLVNPGTYNAAPGNAPDWASGTGWQFNLSGGVEYLTTGWTPANTSISMFIRFSNGISIRGCIMGALSARAQTLLPYWDASTRRHYNGSFTALSAAGAVTSGVMGLAGATGYYNGSSDGTIGGWGDPGAGVPIFIGAGNNANSTLYNGWTVYVQAAVAYSDVLSGAEVATLSAAMAAL